MIPTHKLRSRTMPIPHWDVRWSDDGFGNLIQVPMFKNTETRHFLDQTVDVVQVWELVMGANLLYPAVLASRHDFLHS